MDLATHFLKFTDETAAKTALGIETEGEIIIPSDTTIDDVYMAIDNIGTITKIISEDYSDPENPIIQTETLEGWHVNIACDGDLPTALQAFELHPKNPVREFA